MTFYRRALMLVSGFIVIGFTGTPAAHADKLYNQMLLGSPLEICSSMDSTYCDSRDWIQANDMRTTRLFQLSDVRRKRALRQAIWPESREEVREELEQALEEIADFFGQGVAPERRFVARLRSRSYLSLLMQLSDAEYDRLLDNLELKHTESLKEQANFAQSPQQTQEFATEFVRLASLLTKDKKTPTILLVTAAQRMSYAPIEKYTSFFEQAGAQVLWLPLDSIVARAQVHQKCQDLEQHRRDVLGVFDRDRVYPQRHQEQVDYCQSKTAWQDALGQAQAVYFVDGHAELLRNAFVVDQEPTPLFRVLTGRYLEGSLVVGAEGAAANAMVASNMLTHGTSRSAMAEGAHARKAPAALCDLDNSCPRDLGPHSLTYEAMGGLALYPFGIVDTQLSDKGRQIRMMRLAQTTGAPLAIGIDSRTALMLNTARGYFEVVGEGGAFIVENAMGNEELLASSFHYLRNGSHGAITKAGVNDLILAPQASHRQESLTIDFLDDTGIYDTLGTMCNKGFVELLQDHFTLIMQAGDDSHIQYVLGRCQVINGMIGVQKGEEIFVDQPERDSEKKGQQQ